MISLLSILVWLDDVVLNRHRCNKHDCMIVAAWKVYWPAAPGEPAYLTMCDRHADWAAHIAEVMGFQLHRVEIPLPIDRPDSTDRFSHLEIDP